MKILKYIEKINEYTQIYFVIMPSLFYYTNLFDLKYSLVFLNIHFLNDIVKVILKSDYVYILHHITALSIMNYSYYKGLIYTKYAQTLLDTEISTVFLHLKNRYAGSKKKIIEFLFFVTFTYFRIYKFYIVFDLEFIEVIRNLVKDDILVLTNIFLPIMVLYLLNIYWFLIILSILYKRLFIQRIKI